MKIDNLLSALDEMVIELKNGGKKSSADYFTLKYNILKTSDNHLETIKELSTCRSMAQYANFSTAEENKLDKIVACCLYILKER